MKGVAIVDKCFNSYGCWCCSELYSAAAHTFRQALNVVRHPLYISRKRSYFRATAQYSVQAIIPTLQPLITTPSLASQPLNPINKRKKRTPCQKFIPSDGRSCTSLHYSKSSNRSSSSTTACLLGIVVTRWLAASSTIASNSWKLS